MNSCIATPLQVDVKVTIALSTKMTWGQQHPITIGKPNRQIATSNCHSSTEGALEKQPTLQPEQKKYIMENAVPENLRMNFLRW